MCFFLIFETGIWHDSVVAVKVISARRNTTRSAGGSHRSSSDPDDKLAAELAQHEYESWINANLRHPSIMQLFTAFTVCLDGASSSSIELRPSRAVSAHSAAVAALSSGPREEASVTALVGNAVSASVAASGGPDLGRSSGVGVYQGFEAADHLSVTRCSWKTHLVMEYCDMGTMQVSKGSVWFKQYPECD